jgi:hypothetical protein
MCFVSTPKVNTNPPPPEYLHNTMLDDVGPDGTGANRGVNSLTIPLSSQNDLNAPGAATGAQAGLNVPTSGQSAANPVASGTPAAATAPGVVTPTVGGSLAGAIPSYMMVGISATPGFAGGAVK